MKEGALQEGPQQGQLLPRRGLATLLQLGLQPLHGLQGSLGICGRLGKKSHPLVRGIQSSGFLAAPESHQLLLCDPERGKKIFDCRLFMPTMDG